MTTAPSSTRIASRPKPISFIPTADTGSSASEIDASVTTPLVLSNALPCSGAATAVYSRPSSVR